MSFFLKMASKQTASHFRTQLNVWWTRYETKKAINKEESEWNEQKLHESENHFFLKISFFHEFAPSGEGGYNPQKIFKFLINKRKCA